MRRTLTPTTTANENELVYELNISPRSSLESITTDFKKNPTPDADADPNASRSQQRQSQLSPSIRLLFSLISRRHVLFLIVPAVFSSLVAGGIAPFMTFVVGQAFDAFAQYPQTPNPPQAAKDALLRGVGLAAVELVGLAVGSLALGSLTSCLWIWAGEVNVLALRKTVYRAVTGKDMEWFDMHMGAAEAGSVQTTEGEGPIGAGGLMAKFSRETDDVRMASSLASGMLIQYLTTCLAALILAFLRSWALTLVILSAVPLLMFIQALSQSLAGPLLARERQSTGVAATIIDRFVAAISTVKAFNASSFEQSRAQNAFGTMEKAQRKLNAVWGLTSGVAQFVMMAMFVQGFWFGAKLVRDGKVSAGDVMSVFWACLIATSNLQMCIPMFITLAKGKFAMVALLSMVQDAPAPPRNKRQSLRKITPTRCLGEMALHNITFAYPSRPSMPVLTDVSLFLPANETTFIVGQSGSGKSTIAQLLLRMYLPEEGKGQICLDEQDVRYLDEEWCRKHVGGVGQQGGSGVVILDGKTLFDNVAAGLVGEERPATREEVEDACRAALMVEFVRDLPEGYETVLGAGQGVGLSGGQKQRLEIARARLRNPTVLVLDEATSALDATSRILVFEALKRWRRNKTTIVITHDLSQIEPQDFVYVLKQGRVVEQGFRYDLEQATYVEADAEEDKGEFRKMMESQRQTGGYLPEKEVDTAAPVPEDLLEDTEEDEEDEDELVPSQLKHQSMAIRPLTFGNWMFDVVADLTGNRPAPSANTLAVPQPAATRDSYRVSRYVAPELFANHTIGRTEGRKARPASIQVHSPTSPSFPSSALTLPGSAVERKRLSLPWTPTSTTFTLTNNRSTIAFADEDDEREFDKEKDAVQRSGGAAARLRQGRARRGDIMLESVKVAASPAADAAAVQDSNSTHATTPFWQLMRRVYPTVPAKPLLFLGLLTCLLSGAMTPVFSFLLSRLLFEVSIGATDISTINKFGGIVLGIAALDGVFIGTKYWLMEGVGVGWVGKMRGVAVKRVLGMDKKWFDSDSSSSEDSASKSNSSVGSSPAKIVSVLVKDGDDARNLISVVWGQCLVVSAMLGVGLVWALIKGWQLTLAGVAIAPVFAGVMALQTRLVATCEGRNKRAREEVSRGYYDAIINIRGIRCMSFESIFRKEFDAAADKALHTGVRGAFVEGCTYGVSSGLIYLAEAMLFYVGAVLISKGLYTYLQMVEVLNLVVFSVTIGSQLMAFTEKIAKSVQATSDFMQLMDLPTTTDESQGILCPEPLLGHITFDDVSFAYPSRADAPVLKNVSLTIAEGECVAIVGPSGSGKSTIAALLQRLYEPSSGSISINHTPIHDIQTVHLRNNVSVVSQHPNLFDATIADNIRYGNAAISDVDVRVAAKKANVHQFVMELPQGYDTMVGENAALISGGQAQRLQIARALARPSRVLILDECTSALDPENQATVLETVREAKAGRTTVMVTHKMQVMQMCDRIVVVQDGEVMEQGRFDELMERKGGVFATLARGGEWVGE